MTLGLARRILLIAVGGAMALVGAGMTAVFVGVLVAGVGEDPLGREKLARGLLAVSAGVAICGGFAAIGVLRVRDGIRGSRGRNPLALPRFDSWLRRNWYPAHLGFYAAWVACALVLGGPDAILRDPPESMAQLGWYALLVYLTLPVHVAAHELGHAGAGALAGFRFVSLSVGWMTVRCDGSRLALSWSRPTVAGALGFHAGIPEGEQLLGARLALRAAAGPLTNLALALACGSAAASMEATAGDGAGVALRQVLRSGAWVGFALFAMNVAPFRTRSGLLTDGAIVLQALRPWSRADRALYQFQVNSALGRRPREWGVAASELLRLAEGARAGRDALRLAALGVALDSGDETLAAEILRRTRERDGAPDPNVRYELELQGAMMAALQGRTAEARAALDGLGPHPNLGAYPRLAEAVLQAAEGRLAAAAESLDAWERAVAATGSGPSVRVGNEWAVDRLCERLAAGGARVET